MDDIKIFGVLSILIFNIALFILSIMGAWFISTILANYLALTGLTWWCVVIFIFLFLLRVFNKK